MTMAELALTADAGAATSDVWTIGVASLGIAALAIGIILLIATIVFASRGVVPLAIICGCALLTLILGPVVMLIIAIIALIVLAIQGNVPMAAQIFAGWILGTIIVVVTAVALGLIGAVAA